MVTKLTMVVKWKGDYSNIKIIKIDFFDLKFSWNERIACKKKT